MLKRLFLAATLGALAAPVLVSPAAADTSCRQALGEYKSKYEPFLSEFYNMNDKAAQCALVDQRRREIRNFGTKLKSACTGTSTDQVQSARDDIETFALTALNICGPQ
ncbi:hypothetical protein E2A64_07715 [Pseudohoeflea suaedae]|uniref:DUF1311 domain-containing protein n=1 Tax=Pseudohoeflea suaedae TaxID=877384 RepID=A0A4R5PPI0_9HYPH|nr:hypothetical protein [Pseudohoeflea suaedae]TDH38966.1 hypothetical protein E2A64_07715 [Pseudohoeflea suaedae]